MLKAYKYRIYPTKDQETMILKHFGCARWVYNYGLNQKIESYKTTGKAISRFDIQLQLPKLKKQEETKWLSEVQAQSLQSSLINLDNAFKKFFREKKGFPKFKSKFGRQSYQLPQGVDIDFKNGLIDLGKLKKVKIILSRKFEGKIKTVTISKTPTNKFFVSLFIDNNYQLPLLKDIEFESSIGIDTGIKTFATLSNGQTFDNPKYLKKSLNRLKVLQKRASRKTKGSKNRKKANLKVARIHEKITNQRLDFIHKITHELTKENQFSAICVEDLNIKGIMSNHKLAQSMSDISLGKFYEILKYKCEWRGINFIEIGRFIASSKTCSYCGYINKDLTLSMREWICICGAEHDRDLNAAINIKNSGVAGISQDKETGKG